jgi:hypothetical protein
VTVYAFIRFPALYVLEQDELKFSFKNVFSNVKAAIAHSIPFNVRISTVTWTYYITVKFKFSRCKPIWTRRAAVTFFVLFQSFYETL